jgi:DNA-directed RNA polymerase subunit M/transcription elongation factor TFIIS
MEKLQDLDDPEPMQVLLQCPNCGHRFDPGGSVDRHKLYECTKCLYDFSLAGTAPTSS